jgi:hypothetical protein
MIQPCSGRSPACVFAQVIAQILLLEMRVEGRKIAFLVRLTLAGTVYWEPGGESPLSAEVAGWHLNSCRGKQQLIFCIFLAAPILP